MRRKGKVTFSLVAIVALTSHYIPKLFLFGFSRSCTPNECLVYAFADAIGPLADYNEFLFVFVYGVIPSFIVGKVIDRFFQTYTHKIIAASTFLFVAVFFVMGYMYKENHPKTVDHQRMEHQWDLRRAASTVDDCSEISYCDPWRECMLATYTSPADNFICNQQKVNHPYCKFSCSDLLENVQLESSKAQEKLLLTNSISQPVGLFDECVSLKTESLWADCISKKMNAIFIDQTKVGAVTDNKQIFEDMLNQCLATMPPDEIQATTAHAYCITYYAVYALHKRPEVCTMLNSFIDDKQSLQSKIDTCYFYVCPENDNYLNPLCTKAVTDMCKLGGHYAFCKTK